MSNEDLNVKLKENHGEVTTESKSLMKKLADYLYDQGINAKVIKKVNFQ